MKKHPSSFILKIKNVWKSATGRTIMLMIICVLPMNIFVIADAVRMSENVKTQVQLTTKNVADVYINTVDNIIVNSDYLLYDFVNSNPDCITLSKQEDSTDYINARYRCFWEMNSIVSLRAEGDVLFLYMPDKQDLLLETNSSYTNEKVNLRNYLGNEVNLAVSNYWSIVEIEGRQWLLRVMSKKNFYYGALINLDNRIVEIRDSLSYKESQVVFGETPSGEAEGVVAVASKSKKANLYLNILIPNAEILNSLSFASKGTFLLAGIFLAMIPILYIFVRGILIKPVENLNEAHYQLQIGNQDYRINGTANTIEMESAYQSFNEMADNIQSLKLENVEKELARKKIELNNLQLQIRPHFLQNIFNLIFILTERKNCESIRELILYISEYFRYLYRSGKELELFDKEHRLIEGYVKAAQIRYPGQLDINYQIDPEIQLVRVPPLLIHNFVENIVNHALVVGRVVHITLFAGYEDGVVTFQISDNGQGIEPHVVGEINEGRFVVNEERVHVGIHNSILRLKYFYGSKAQLQVESELGEGTVFTISFPYYLEDE